MRLADMCANDPEGCCQHGCIIGEAKPGHDIRNGVHRQDEITKRCKQDQLDLGGGHRVQRAVIGGSEIVGKGDPTCDAEQLGQ